MKVNKILFVGLGGAGQRHLRIFRKLLPPKTEFSGYRSIGKTPLLKSDFSVNKDSTIEEKYNLKLFRSLEESLENKPDLVVISTPTNLHFNVAKKAAEKKVNIFVEKPFSHNLEGFEDFKKIIEKNNLCFFISFQRRFHPYFQKIKEIISRGSIGKIISAVFNVGSYVPAWHPYEDFMKLYACRKDLGGGVLLTEIHELDLCYWYFGYPEKVYCAGGNYSEFSLDVEDTAQVTLKYNSFSVQVNLCFMQKHTRIDLYIAGTKGYVEWSTEGDRLIVCNYEKNDTEVYSNPDYANDDMFLAQASYFLKEVSQADRGEYLETARASLAIVEAAKESMAKGVEIKVDAGR